MKQISKAILFTGVNDHELDLFEGQYPLPQGISYNSYVILDEKTAVMDTADARKTAQWLSHVAQALGGRQPDYLVIQHMEPDHSASLLAFLKVYPAVTVVGNGRTFAMIRQFFPDFKLENTLTVKDGETLCLGNHTLHFIFAPMVHWPEVMMSYESSERVLFSADAFGRFGVWEQEDAGEEARERWAEEAGRYYFGIVGKYGAQVQNVLKKAAALDVQMICPLHGPVLKEELSYYMGLYDTWSSYRPQKKGVCICYASVYGHTEAAVLLLAGLLRDKGVEVICHDLSRSDWSKAVADAFVYDRLVLSSITYNGEVFPAMKSFLGALAERGYRSRLVAFMENGSWAPMANKVMQTVVQRLQDITVAQNSVTIRSALSEAETVQVQALAEELSS